MHLRTFLKPLSFIPAILMMYVIFMFSAQEADVSSSVSQKVSVTIVKSADYVFDMNLDDWKIQEYAFRINKVTRKLAHMTEYFLLAIAVSFPLYVYGLHGILLVLVAGIICVGYACSDEYHQAFVAGRAASVKDVGIDSVGVLIGILLVRIIGWTGRHTIFRPLPDQRYQKQTRREMKRLRRQQEEMQRRMEEQAAFRPREEAMQGPRQGFYENTQYNKEERYARDPYYRERYPQDPYYQSGYIPDPRYEEEPAADELSDDMPLSGLFRKPR